VRVDWRSTMHDALTHERRTTRSLSTHFWKRTPRCAARMSRFLWWLFMSVERMAWQMSLRTMERLCDVSACTMLVSGLVSVSKHSALWCCSITLTSLYRMASCDHELMW
jgi:hypothetical protein